MPKRDQVPVVSSRAVHTHVVVDNWLSHFGEIHFPVLIIVLRRLTMLWCKSICKLILAPREVG